MEDIVKVIFQLEADNSKAIAGLNEVNSKYTDSTNNLKAQQSELRKLVAQETELLQARAKSSNPTIIAQYNSKLKETSSQIAATKAAIDAQTAATNNLKRGTADLSTQMKQAFDATKINAVNKELKNSTNEFTKLKQQLKEAKGELLEAFATGNQKAIQDASQKVGKLKDEINDLNKQTEIFAGGTKFEQIRNLFGGITGNLFSLNFKQAEEQSRSLLATTKSITFAEAKAGISQLGGTLANIGKSLLANPLFLLGTAFSVLLSFLPDIIDKLGLFESSSDKAKRALDGLNASMGLANANLETQAIKLQNTIDKLEKANAPLGVLVKHYKDLEKIKLTQLNNDLSVLEKKQQAIIDKVVKGTAINAASSNPLFSALSFFGFSSKDMDAAATEIANNQKDIINNKNQQLQTTQETDNKIEDLRLKRLEEQRKKEQELFDEAFKQASAADDRAADRSKRDRKEFLRDEEEKFQEAIRIANKADDRLAEENKKRHEDDKNFRAALAEGYQADADAAAKAAEERKERVKKQLKEEEEARKAQIQRQLNDIQTLTNATLDASKTVLSAKQHELDKLSEIQTKRVADAKEIADKGNAELYELEQKRLDDINKQREEFARRQQAIAAIELTANSLIAIAKAAAQGGVAAPVTIAATLIALAAGLVQARTMATQAAGSFYEGGYTGDGNPRQESKALGRKPYTYHKGEFVMNHEKTSRYKDIFEDIHKGNIDLREWQTKVKAFESMRALSMVSNPNSATNTAILEAKMDKVISAINGQSTSVSLDENGLSLRFKKIRTRNDYIRNNLGRA